MSQSFLMQTANHPKPRARSRAIDLVRREVSRGLVPVFALAFAACSGSDERIDPYPRANDARPTAAPAPTPTPTPVPTTPPPPAKPNEAALADPKCAPAFATSVRGPTNDPPAENACLLIHRSFADAKDTLVKGCDGADAAMCTLLGSMLGQVDWFGAELAVFVPPCHPKDRCWGRYQNAGTSLFTAASHDATDAMSALEKGCNLGGAPACEAWSLALVARADARANDITKKACELGRGLDCRMIVERALKAKDTPDPAVLRAVIRTEKAACDGVRARAASISRRSSRWDGPASPMRVKCATASRPHAASTSAPRARSSSSTMLRERPSSRRRSSLRSGVSSKKGALPIGRSCAPHSERRSRKVSASRRIPTAGSASSTTRATIAPSTAPNFRNDLGVMRNRRATPSAAIGKRYVLSRRVGRPREPDLFGRPAV